MTGLAPPGLPPPPPSRPRRWPIGVAAALVLAAIAAALALADGDGRARRSPRPSATPATSPSPTASPTSAPRCSVALGSYELRVSGGGVPAADELQVRRAARAARDHFDVDVPVCERGRVTVRVLDRANARYAAVTRVGRAPRSFAIVVYAGGASWDRSSPEFRTFVVLHEWYHVVEFALLRCGVRCRSLSDPVPGWLVEGAAEYRAARAAADLRLAFYSVIRRSEIAAARSIDAPLRSLERIRRPSNAAYGLAFAAVELLASLGGQGSIDAFFARAGRSGDWQRAFRRSFGLPVSAFYRAFESHRAGGFAR